MSHRIRISVGLAILSVLLAPISEAQKPPAPPPPSPPSPPRSGTPSQPSLPINPNTSPVQPGEDRVVFLLGRITTPDGGALPMDVLIERVCNNKVRQQVYASPSGDFSMQLGSRTDSFPEASADVSSGIAGNNNNSIAGITRRDLMNCELRTSASGFRPAVTPLLDVNSFGSSVDLGAIVLQRGAKIKGATLNAAPYKAPKDARKAYEKGLQAEKNGNLEDARKYFETAVELYPGSADSWFQLGSVLQKTNQLDAARKAFTRSTTINSKFLSPYLSLASIAYQAGNWTEVLDFTGHILDLDPLNNASINSYILDLDPMNYADAYCYNALANYRLNKIEDAEKSALKAEHLDLRTHFPQIHLLLAEIFARKNHYANAITEIQTYLELAPHASNAVQARELQAKWEKLNDTESQGGKPDLR
jgi:lipoprotein NlpI